MHCNDGLTSTGGQVACYVKNYAGGDDASEFTFGLSANIAFKNMDLNRPFATVAMVYRRDVSGPNNVFFIVYGANESLQTFAALDRTGQLSANAFAAHASDAAIDGTNYNNHIPSNCVNCHGGGGSYDAATHSVTGGLFLPFDLDQFDYQPSTGKRRADQLTTFKHLNEMTWKVAALSGSDGTGSLRAQLNGWYSNTNVAAVVTDEVFENDFNSNYVPSGWASPEGTKLYQGVVRGTCRSCHVADQKISFDTEAQFKTLANLAVADICNFAMPHALQSTRLFWQSSQPLQLANYLKASGKSAEATTLNGCGPRNVATLDPPLIAAVQ